MSIVKISKRKIYIPNDIPFDAKRVIIIPISDNLLIIPISERPIEIDIKESISKLKRKAEKRARHDTIKRRLRGYNLSGIKE